MINPNELRIGNYINIAGIQPIDKVYVTGVLPDKIYYTPSKNKQFADFLYTILSYVEPIPLTEEWLIKFGFTPDKYNLVYDHPLPATPENEHKDLGTSYPSFFYNKRLNRWMDCHTRVCIDYVHQLQNLYFALTGEELTIK